MAAFAIATLAAGIADALQNPGTPRAYGLVAGVPFGVAIVAVVVALWVRHWSPMGAAAQRESEGDPAALVVAGRLPNLAYEVMERAWPAEVAPMPAPQMVVAVVDEQGVRVRSVGGTPVDLVSLRWEDVADVRVVEYVEAGKAYEGFALLLPSPGRAVVIQAVIPGRFWPRFLRGARLEAVASHVRARRSID